MTVAAWTRARTRARATAPPPAPAVEQMDGIRAAVGTEAAALYGAGERSTGQRAGGLTTAFAEAFPVVFLLVVTDGMGLSFGVGRDGVRLVRMLCLALAAAGAVAGAAATHRRTRRATLVAASTTAAGVLVAVASLSDSFLVTAAAAAAAAFALGAGRTARHALAGDVGTTADRAGSFEVDRACSYAGGGLLAVVALTLPGGWRSAGLAAAVATVLLGLWATRLRDPGYGLDDAAPVRRLVNRHSHTDADVDERLPLSFGEALRQVLGVQATRAAVLGVFSLGSAAAAAWVFTTAVLEERKHVALDDRVVLVGLAALAGAAVALGVRRLGLTPADTRRAGVAWPMAGALALGAASFLPGAVAAALAVTVVFAALVLTEAAMAGAVLAGVPPMLRPHAAALAGAGWFLGVLQGIVLGGSLEGRYGPTTTLVFTALLILLPTAGSLAAARKAAAERARVVAGHVVEDQAIRALGAGGAEIPLLVCSHVDFAYGSLQVLFDTSFTVREGEMVALLGTNGAGKSTLLRAISGLGRPSAGVIRFDGHDVTNLDAQRRVASGIVQVPGGRATFPTMTVVDNLRAHGYLVPDGRVLDTRIDDVFDAFPALARRRSQPASVLSGGEAQMLALGKALLLRPRVLLIDELTLGLAPVVVGELLDLVRRINAEGTSVVLVEQSVNIALSLVDHAYFMEKGRIRFDGPASELLGRDDLLRSVFLEGAGSVR